MKEVVKVKRSWEEMDNSREEQQLPDFLIDEFEKLCNRKESDKTGFEPSVNIPNNGGVGPWKMLKTICCQKLSIIAFFEHGDKNRKSDY